MEIVLEIEGKKYKISRDKFQYIVETALDKKSGKWVSKNYYTTPRGLAQHFAQLGINEADAESLEGLKIAYELSINRIISALSDKKLDFFKKVK